MRPLKDTNSYIRVSYYFLIEEFICSTFEDHIIEFLLCQSTRSLLEMFHNLLKSGVKIMVKLS